MNSFWNGKRRFIALLMFLAGVFVALRVPPVIPVIQLPGEIYPAGYDLPFLDIRLTNTFMGSILVWIILILFAAYITRRRPKSGTEVPPGGFYNMFEALFEGLMGFVGGIAGGRHFRVIFNTFMTIFLIVLISNWLELVPGVDSVGFIEPHLEEEYDAEADEFEIVTTDGFEIYPSVVGYALNGQCNWIGAETKLQRMPQPWQKPKPLRSRSSKIWWCKPLWNALKQRTVADMETKKAAILPKRPMITVKARKVTMVTGIRSWRPRTRYWMLALAAKQARADRGCYSGVGPVPWAADEQSDDHGDDEEHADGEDHGVPLHPAPNSEEAKLVPWVVLPFIRVPSTDLNMTLSIALIAFAMIQVIGFKALGIGYLGKFFAFGTLFKSPLGGIDVAVGLLELIGDFAKVLSFSFRLLGNIFAGSILLFVMSFLVPILPWPFFILEFFVGIIQALVFALLTAIFMNLATVSHHHDDDHADEH